MNRKEAEELLAKLDAAMYATNQDFTSSKKWEEYTQLLEKAIDAMCEDKWIPIIDILPEPYEDFLVWLPHEDCNTEVGYFDHEFGKDWFIGRNLRYPLSAVTHYQPLPEGPRKENCDERGG